jgi:predicted transcriptional regulator
MTTNLNSTLPERQPKRALMFSIRLTEAEQNEIDALAKRLKLPSSFMARHFILEAVNHHKNQMMLEATVEA